MLNTVEFGYVRVVEEAYLTRLDTYFGQDIVGEWNFYQLADNGEIVAVENI